MSDWLNDDSDGYLGLDNPEMPQTAPAPPTPADAGDWLGAGMPAAGNDTGGAPVMDTQGDWLGGDSAGSAGAGFDDPYGAAAPAPQQHQSAPMAAPPAPPHHTQQPYGGYADTPAPMPMAQSFDGDLQVSAPMLEHVQPNPRSIGGTRGQLSSLVLDVEVQVEVGLGNAALTVEEFLEMGSGSVVELDQPIDAPIELKVRGKLIARGQLVSINGSYGMRIIEMVNEEQ